MNSLKYGSAQLEIPAAWSGWDELSSRAISGAPDSFAQPARPLPGEALRAALAAPVGMRAREIETLFKEAGQQKLNVAIAVPDETRRCGLPDLLPPLMDWLNRRGVSDSSIQILIALGIHRPMTYAEQECLLGAEIMRRASVLQPNTAAQEDFINLGKTLRGTPIEFFCPAADAGRLILLGSVTWHYFAGFGGGRKLLMPGLASKRAAQGNHLTAMDLERGVRRPESATGRLDGNPVYEDAIEAAARLSPSLGINILTSPSGEPEAIFAGDWIEAHRAACQAFSDKASVPLEPAASSGAPASAASDASGDEGGQPETAGYGYGAVAVSAGGYPGDINLVQAHKSLDMAAAAVRPGGWIVWIAECREGYGSEEMRQFARDPGGSAALAAWLRENYHSHAQAAHALRDKTERFRIILLSEFPKEDVRAMNMTPVHSLEEAAQIIQDAGESHGLLMPWGAKLRPVLQEAKT